MANRFLLFVSVLVAAFNAGCSSRQPEVAPAAYREAVTAFHVGIAAMQTSQDVLARQKLDRVTALVPQEPAGWANLGLLLLRQQELDQGAQRLEKAAQLAPESAAIQRLQALAESRRGNLPAAISHWRRALALDAQDARAAYALALDTERQGGADNDAEAQRILAQLAGRRDNLAARLEYLRIAAKRGDQAAAHLAIAPLTTLATSWGPEAQQQFNTLVAALKENPRTAAVRVAFLKNVLLREPRYQRDLADVTTPLAEVGQPLMQFVVLKNPDAQPAAPDEALTFATESTQDARAGASWTGAISLTGEGNPVAAAAGAAGIQVSGSVGTTRCAALSGLQSGVTAPDAVAIADLNYDFRPDVAVAGPGGLCLLRQTDAGRFTDVTAAAKLTPGLVRTALHAVWAADIDTDGDLDLVVGPREGGPVVLRNNGDGTFTRWDLFTGVTRVRGFVWADLDGEGVPDAAFLDESGTIQVFLNQRAGSFRRESPPQTGRAAAIAVADQDGDLLFDLLVLTPDGAIARLSRSPADGKWSAAALARVEPPAALAPGAARLLAADLDNNGAADLIAATAGASRVLLAGAGGSFSALKAAVPIGVQATADLDGDGRLDLIGLGQNGQPARATSRGAKSYRWESLRPRAATATGDQRINSFGIGGEIELRTGLHVQKQVIASPIVHFGLGEADRADVARITWPNGILQAEFDTGAGQAVKATQRLKGSCPWLFAWNGREMSFVTDLLWRSPLGLRINAQATADTLMTEDWVRVRGDQIAARDGAYDLRVTAELWETHFFDLVSLMAVDHPRDTEVFVDERFAVPPPRLQLVATGPVQPFASVRADTGADVTDLAASSDSRYVDFAGRGAYQGITRTHLVEMELPEGAPRTGPLWLVARGWIHPTDSSINVAIGQGRHDAPEGLSLWVADARGRYRPVRTGLGFPAGKDKTILIDLTGVFASSAPRRLRLATNLEIFWDRLGWAVGRPDVAVRTRRLDLKAADLVYRGYSVTEQPNQSAPERPRYVLAGTAPRWRDLEGYYTRFGDVIDLLRHVDDRYVIMNAGDELRLRFPEAPAAAEGLVRDFVVIADGWEKDGDYNTTFSRTVLPLPTHETGRYDRPPRGLEDDGVYRRHPQDFAEYHTRYVTGDEFRDALRVPADPKKP
jgi:tetratricopeptide (TPR) repeat protein